MMKQPILILGLGNVLMGDEGIGVSCIEYLRKRELPEGIDLMDGGTGGFHLLSLFGKYSRMILIDATIGSGNPGEVRVIRPRFASDFPRSLTSHDIGLRDLVQSAELLDELPYIHLITVTIQDLRSVRIGISSYLQPCLEVVYQTVMNILAEELSLLGSLN